MKKLLTLLALLPFCLPAAHAQHGLLPVRIMATPKPAPERFTGTDAFGWNYIIADNEFRKQKEGKTLKYKNVALGDIYRADLQNPLQIVLFYKKFNTVVLLDNQLNETTVINFNELAQPIIADAVGLASQNRLWVYDVTMQQTGLFNLKQHTFRALTPPNNTGLQWYQTDYNYFYWIDNEGHLFSVNLFGNVVPLGNVPVFNEAQLLATDALVLKTDNTLQQFSPALQKAFPIPIVEKTFSAFYYNDGILSIFTDSEIVQYKLILPRK